MKNSTVQNWYVVGYLRTVPGERTFVFPIVQNADVAVGRAYYSLNGPKLEFVEPDSQEEIIRISPIEIPGITELRDALPLYGYEFEPGKVWIGDACQLSKALIDFACRSELLTARERREILDFIERVLERSEFIAKNRLLLQGNATLSENLRPTPFNEDMAGTRIKVVGVGDAGCNAVTRMMERDVSGIEFICANTDANALSRSPGHRLLQLGLSGLSTDGRPVTGKKAAEHSIEEIKVAIAGAHMLFIAVGMGGGTGTGAAPVIARVAQDMGIMTVAIVTMPFDFEGQRRIVNAKEGVSALEAQVDSLFVVRNDRILETSGEDLSQGEAFAQIDDVLANIVLGVSGIINVPGHVNVDFEDVRLLLNEPGKAMFGTADASGESRARVAAELAVASPLLGGIDLSSAKGVLVLLSAAKGSLRLSESKLALNTIRAYAASDAHVIYGTVYDDSLGEKIRVTLLVTGVSEPIDRRAEYRRLKDIPNLAFEDKVFNLPLSDFIIEGHIETGIFTAKRSKQEDVKSDALVSGGMEEYEIPAFLRKQAD